MLEKKASVSVLISIIVIISIVLLFLFSSAENNKEIKRFEEHFRLKLPRDTSVVFSEDDHGALGDGVSLYIYQMSPDDMQEFIKQHNNLNYWARLPVDAELSSLLWEKVKGLSSERIADAMNIYCQKGYYIIKNRHDRPLEGYDVQDFSYYNVIIAIIDEDYNKIHYLQYDM